MRLRAHFFIGELSHMKNTEKDKIIDLSREKLIRERKRHGGDQLTQEEIDRLFGIIPDCPAEKISRLTDSLKEKLGGDDEAQRQISEITDLYEAAIGKIYSMGYSDGMESLFSMEKALYEKVSGIFS